MRVVAGTLFSDLGQGLGQWKAPDNIFEKVLLPPHAMSIAFYCLLYT